MFGSQDVQLVLAPSHVEHPSAHFSHLPSKETYPFSHDAKHWFSFSSNVNPSLHDVHLFLVSSQS